MSHDTTADVTGDARGDVPRRVPALCLCWSLHEPARVGEVALLPRPGRDVPFGRGDAAGPTRLRFIQQRPGRVTLTPDLDAPAVSRNQLRIVAGDGVVHVENIGRCEMLIDGRRESSASLRPGEVLHLRNQLSLVVVERAVEWPALDLDTTHPFGRADSLGLVGESEAAWRLRHQIRMMARVPEHLLIVAEAGAGASLVAEAVHRSSPDGEAPLVVRGAGELEGQADLLGSEAEPGGVLAAAAGGTLVLDTIEALAPRLQATLARLLDASPRRTARDAAPPTARIIATTRDPAAAATLGSRLPLRLEVPPLAARLEDIALIFRALAARAAASAPDLQARFVDPSTGEVRVDPRLVSTLLSRPHPGNVRGLDLLLWTSIAEAADDYLGVTEGVARELGLAPGGARPEPSSEDIERALERHAGNQSRAFRDLGLANRFALIRLMKKHGISPRTR